MGEFVNDFTVKLKCKVSVKSLGSHSAMETLFCLLLYIHTLSPEHSIVGCGPPMVVAKKEKLRITKLKYRKTSCFKLFTVHMYVCMVLRWDNKFVIKKELLFLNRRDGTIHTLPPGISYRCIQH